LPEQDRALRAPIVAFSKDWNTDPTSNTHLMRLLAERADVLWVESSGMRRPNAGRVADWRRIGKKIRAMTGGLRPGAPGMTVLSPPALPFPTSRVARAINARLYHWAIRRALGQMRRASNPLLWVYIPTVARYLDLLPSRGLVYHCIDRWWAFSEYDSTEMRRCHEILCRRADHVFASSRELFDDCRQLSDHVSYLPHGVDARHFATAVAGPIARPADLPSSSRPIVGFIGLIDDWVDLSLVRAVALANPSADVVLIGAARAPVDALAGLPNVYLLGRKPFAELPAYLASFEVALIPFVLNDLTRAVNPIKLREYLGAGVPVVTTALPELAPFRGHTGVDIADDDAGFVAAVSQRLARPIGAQERQALSASMAGESWSARLDQMLDQVGHLL
jgi:glycosyltransferase involved in cell wall biosynthesis